MAAVPLPSIPKKHSLASRVDPVPPAQLRRHGLRGRRTRAEPRVNRLKCQVLVSTAVDGLYDALCAELPLNVASVAPESVVGDFGSVVAIVGDDARAGYLLEHCPSLRLVVLTSASVHAVTSDLRRLRAKVEAARLEAEDLQAMLERQLETLHAKEADLKNHLAEYQRAEADAQSAIRMITKRDLAELKAMLRPPDMVRMTLEAAMIMLGLPETAIRQEIGRTSFISTVLNFSPEYAPNFDDTLARLEGIYFSNPSVTFEAASRASMPTGALHKWLCAQRTYAAIVNANKPLLNDLHVLARNVEQLRAESAKSALTCQRLPDFAISAPDVSRQVAEFCLCSILSHERKFFVHADLFDDRTWKPQRIRTTQNLAVFIIVGDASEVAPTVADTLTKHGFRVLLPGTDTLCCDIIINLDGLFGSTSSSCFAQLKTAMDASSRRSPLYIDASALHILSERDLIHALRAGTFSHAVLDLNACPPEDSVLWETGSDGRRLVTMTPNLSSGCDLADVVARVREHPVIQEKCGEITQR